MALFEDPCVALARYTGISESEGLGRLARLSRRGETGVERQGAEDQDDTDPHSVDAS
jgi:hypothetical protein